MPNINFADEEHPALAAAARKVMDEDRYPLSPRLRPLKSALAKLDPKTSPKPAAERRRCQRGRHVAVVVGERGVETE